MRNCQCRSGGVLHDVATGNTFSGPGWLERRGIRSLVQDYGPEGASLITPKVEPIFQDHRVKAGLIEMTLQLGYKIERLVCKVPQGIQQKFV